MSLSPEVHEMLRQLRADWAETEAIYHFQAERIMAQLEKLARDKPGPLGSTP